MVMIWYVFEFTDINFNILHQEVHDHCHQVIVKVLGHVKFKEYIKKAT